MPSDSPLVSVVVVNYNSGDHLPACLTALGASDTPLEIFIVDNASTDGSLALAAEFSATKILKNTVNRGYAGGVNVALPHARGDYVMALNPDTRVAPDCVSRVLAFLETTPRAGAVNPLILLQPGGERINAAGQAVHVTGLGFNRRLGQPRPRAGVEPVRVSGMQGGAVIVRKKLLEQMGGWDESGFLYHEDVELSWLLHLMGYDLYCVPQATVTHDYHLTMYPEKLFLLERNRVAMLITNLRAATLLGLAPLLLTTELMMWGYCLLRGWNFLQAKAASYRWVFQHRRALAQRQAFVNSLRQCSDWAVLKKLQWGYAWDQFFTLGQERGESQRQPAGGLPVKVGKPE
jgi:hypothetical protein